MNWEGLKHRVEAIIELPVHSAIGDRATSACGKKFDEVCSGGIVPESNDFDAFQKAMRYFDTEEEADEAYLENVRRYAKGKTGKLYWRCPPHDVRGFDTPGYRIHSRMVIG